MKKYEYRALVVQKKNLIVSAGIDKVVVDGGGKIVVKWSIGDSLP